jgi:hypothetical protein
MTRWSTPEDRTEGSRNPDRLKPGSLETRALPVLVLEPDRCSGILNDAREPVELRSIRGRSWDRRAASSVARGIADEWRLRFVVW